ncbi:unnamed protein product [Malus baccata var. baccata]
MPKITPTIILDKRGLRGQRFLAWYRHIENVSKVKDILYELKQSPPHEPPTKLASNEECQDYARHYEDDLQTKCLILTSLSEELKKLHENMDTSCAMVDSLHKMHDIETSASQHICNSLQGLTGSRTLRNGEMIVRVGNGTKISAKAIGTYMLKLPSGEVLELKNCLYFPSCIKNLISISKLLRDGHSVLFGKMSCTLYLNGRIISHGNMIEGLFHLETSSGMHCIESGNTSKPKRAREEVNQVRLWHLKLGHVNQDKIRKMSKDGYLSPLGNDLMGTCAPCLLGKMTKSPFTGKGEHAIEIIGLIHTDSESFERFKEFKNEVEKQTRKQIKILRSDRGGEYLSNEFLDYLKECGIVSQWTPPGTPQHNGVSEMRNRTLMNMVHYMMNSADLTISFWGYALHTTAYLLNAVPSKSVPQTPYEIWYGKKPSLKHVKIWGCPTYVQKQDAGKLEPRSVKCYFVGYPKQTYGYEFYHPDDQKVFVARTAIFMEDEFVLNGTSKRKIELKEINEINDEPQKNTRQVDNPVPEPLAPRRSERVSIPPKRYGLDNDFGELHLLGDNDTKEDPRDYTEAMSDIDSKRWQGAMKSEMDSMYQNQVWTLVDPPEDDILLFGNDTTVLSFVKVWLSKTFHMKDLGDASYVLGIKLYRDRSRKLIGLPQSMYIDKVLSRFQMEQSKKGLLPVRHGIHLSKSMGPKTPEEIRQMSAILYASAIGSLMYAMICTRPDIAYVVSITSRYQSNPGLKHWTAVKTICIQSEWWAVSWKSKKQSVIADSTTEAEYVVVAEAGKEAFWMKKFIIELGVAPTITSPVTLYRDNSGAIAQAKEPRAHKKNKHFDRRFNIIRRYVAEWKVNILKVALADNVSDPLTKPMSQIQLDRHMEKWVLDT